MNTLDYVSTIVGIIVAFLFIIITVLYIWYVWKDYRKRSAEYIHKINILETAVRQ